MRSKFVPALLLLLLAVAGCGGDSENSPGTGTGSNPDGSVAGLGKAVPSCPFTAAKVSELVGEPMEDQGNCLFGDGKGIASVTITMSSELAGSMTYDYQRKTAVASYDKVTDLDTGGKGYVAAEDIQGEAVRINKNGSYTLILSSFVRFESDPAKYEQTLRALLDALPA